MKVTFGLTEKNLEVIKKHLSYDGAEYSDHVWEIIGREIGWHPLTAALWYFKKLSQSENVQGSDTTGDERRGEAGNKPSLSAEEVLKKYTHSNILPYSEWLHKAMEEYKNQASNQTPVKECEEIKHYLSWCERWMYRLSKTNPELFRDFDKNRIEKIRQLLETNVDGNFKIVRSAQQTPVKECYVPVTDDEMLAINYDMGMAEKNNWFASRHGWLKKVPVTDCAPALPQPTGEEEDIRREVKWFAAKMESKLKENDHKGGWDYCGNSFLLKRLKEEVSELSVAVRSEFSTSERIIGEAADVANFAMMIAHNTKEKEQSPIKY